MRIWKSRWVRRIVLGVVLTVIGRTAWLVGEREWRRAHAEQAFAAATAETEATDPGWRLPDLNAARKVVSPEVNSSLVLTRVLALAPRELKLDPGAPWEPTLPTTAPNLRPDPGLVARARGTLQNARPAVDLAVTLKDLPLGRADVELTPDVLSTRLPHIDAVRFAQFLLQWESALSLEDNNPDRAVAAALAALNASRSIGDEFFLISQVVRMSARGTACRTLERLLAQARLRDDSLSRLLAAWSEDADEPLLLYGLRGERAVTDVMLANLIDGTVSSVDGMKAQAGWFDRYAWWLYRVRLMNDRVYLHQYFTKAVTIVNAPIHEQAPRLGELPSPPDPSELKIAALFLPAVEKCAAAHWRTTADMRCATVGIACERYRITHARWPMTLAEMVPKFLPAVPLDPFGGQPLRYLALEDGVVVHSVGSKSLDAKVPPHPGLPDDIHIGFRLWNPDARRLAPPPEPKPEAAP